MSATTQTVFAYLVSNAFRRNHNRPMNDVQAVGVLASFRVVSGLDPKRVDPDGIGHGIAQ